MFSSMLKRRKRPELTWQGRVGTWQEGGVLLVAVQWLWFKLELRDCSLRQGCEALRRLLEEEPHLEMGPETGPVVIEEAATRSVVVALSRRSRDLRFLREFKRRELKTKVGEARATYVEGVDTASKKYVKKLRSSWQLGPSIDAAGIVLPSHWFFSSPPEGGRMVCELGTHWHDFARQFGEVEAVQVAWLEGQRLGDVMLLAHFTTPKTAEAVHEALAGRCLYHPSLKQLSPLRLVFGHYKKLSGGAFWGAWGDDVLPRPLGSTGGPVFELRLASFDAKGLEMTRICLAPWRAKLVCGRSSRCELPLRSSTISMHHAELQLTPHGHVQITDFSANGTYVNASRLQKDVPVAISDGDVISFGDPNTGSYILRRFQDLSDLEAASSELEVPCWPFFRL